MDKGKNKKVYMEYSMYTDKRIAGSKAVLDSALIVESSGYSALWFMMGKEKKNKVTRVINQAFTAISRLVTFLRISNKSLFFIQHPSAINKTLYLFIKYISAKKNIGTIFLIHDFESLRLKQSNIVKIEEVIIKNASAIICHNEKMMIELIKRGALQNKLINLEIFDYIVEKPLKPRDDNGENGIIFAGNLDKNKSSFIYKFNELSDKLNYHLYGPNYVKNDSNDFIKYHGALDPEDLPDTMVGSYGLVWDGDSLESCTGVTGEYLKYNNPHKASLYIASGIPVVVWDKSAMSDYVIDNDLGITVSSLYDLDEAIDKISAERYLELKKNAEAEGYKLRKGFYLKRALMQAEKLFEEKES
ncbi:MAG: hypothetical protein LBR74_02280 [Eubacterium sp.]|jgi:glycosyltransferase involved in cell wall biosynthesis|nr:hypothetical protein [Eubacterium sp.]